MHFVREGFAIRMIFSIVELEYAVIKAEELQKRPGARQMVMPWLRCPNPRTREGEAGETKAKEDKGPVAGTVQEAGTDGTAAEDEEEDDTDVVSETVETVITQKSLSHRHHTSHSTHITGISTSNRLRHLSNISSVQSRPLSNNSSFHSSSSSITTPGRGGTRPAKGVDNPGTLRPDAPA